MRLYVYVMEARDLAVKNSSCFVEVQVGKHKSKTRILRNANNPAWNIAFVFGVYDMNEELVVSCFHQDDDFINGLSNGVELIGRVRIPVGSAATESYSTLPPAWYSFERPKSGKFVNRDCGKILLTLSLHEKRHDAAANDLTCSHSNITEESKETDSPCVSSHGVSGFKSPCENILGGKQLMKGLRRRMDKLLHKNDEGSRSDDSSELSSSVSDYEDCTEEQHSGYSFEESLAMMQSIQSNQKMPQNLQGGILIDQAYVVSPNDLNVSLFTPNSQFRRDLAELQGTTDIHEGPWMWKSGEMSCLTRVVTYINAATKLVKAVKATEEQTYLTANGREFAVLSRVFTPEVPCGSSFKVELLYKISPGPELPSREESSHLVISWEVNFLRSTLMKCMIEGGVRQGLKDSFEQFSSLMAQKFKVLNFTDLSDKDHILANMQAGHQSDWELAKGYFWNMTVVSTIFMVLYIMVHILHCEPSEPQGLEFHGFDLPDSIGEFITCGILVLQLERVYNMVQHFVQARLQQGSDHGVKSQGHGWALTVALIEGTNLASLNSSGFSDPYVVFTSNGKTRTSSVRLQTTDPQWNDILEFDAMEEPPSVLDVEVFDLDGPFDQAMSLGHAEINFLKPTATELADMWVPLEGNLAQSSQSKLHLRIFLDNNNGLETIKEYMNKMEKEVGKKFYLRSPHRNSAFQKLFGLPPEEFLVSDFSCAMKRKMPVQGRLFLSARIVGFYANLFGHKTIFFFLWEDIEDIQEHPPSLSSVGIPLLVIVLKKDRGIDARHGAKCQDEEGRLRFYFQSFLSFSSASRTIVGLWRTRALSPDRKAQIAEDQDDYEERLKTLEDSQDTESILDLGDTKMSKVYTAQLPVNTDYLMEMFNGGKLEHNVMGKSGCLNYATTAWESIKPNVFQRCLSYSFNRNVSIFGGEVACRQQKSPIANGEGWIIDEVMALHDVLFSDHFRVQLRYRIENSGHAPNACKCNVYVRVTWLKSTMFLHRIKRNIAEKFAHRLKDVFELVEKEILLTPQQGIGLSHFSLC
ncbi:C2 and GRAM domain-containing protein At5g50170 [Argentina anserina]|uniref:C2 and GRAM domain-containing protein At5g50170 n=1 Tax=Argentina anserina TaxID=57926 RepID=UPI0021763FBE|nr:C2 and GRAM domain-containing protein At5g50170 [Potentilla anserina]